jgi:hypothetical protein
VAQDLEQLGPDRSEQATDVVELLGGSSGPDTFEQVLGGCHANVSAEQRGLEVLKVGLIDLPAAHTLPQRGEEAPGATQPLAVGGRSCRHLLLDRARRWGLLDLGGVFDRLLHLHLDLEGARRGLVRALVLWARRRGGGPSCLGPSVGPRTAAAEADEASRQGHQHHDPKDDQERHARATATASSAASGTR